MQKIFFLSFFRIYLGKVQFPDAENAFLYQEGFGKSFINYPNKSKFPIKNNLAKQAPQNKALNPNNSLSRSQKMIKS